MQAKTKRGPTKFVLIQLTPGSLRYLMEGPCCIRLFIFPSNYYKTLWTLEALKMFIILMNKLQNG